MTTTWILIAHRAGARVFENKGPGKGVRLVQDFPHPKGRLKDQELSTDKPGRNYAGPGMNLRAMGNEVSPTEHVAEQFAKHLSDSLESARVQHRFERLVVIAEPRFLGNLRSSFTGPTAGLVTATVAKDLGPVETHEVAKHLEEVMLI